MRAHEIAVFLSAALFAGTAAAAGAKPVDYEARILALEGAVAALQTRVISLEATVTIQQTAITALRSRTNTIEASSVMDLAPYLQVTTTGTPKALLSGINLQIVNGVGRTNSWNGTGNLIIGYNLLRNDGVYFCSNGMYGDQASCETAGALWADNHKSGSHNLVIGDYNNYSRHTGVVVGLQNTITQNFASVIGGTGNVARGASAAVIGGVGNRATGNYATVSGGDSNTAAQTLSSVSGGVLNTATGISSSVCGGRENEASGRAASVSGGRNNEASGDYSAVGAGFHNAAVGDYSVVIGSHDYSASSLYDIEPEVYEFRGGGL